MYVVSNFEKSFNDSFSGNLSYFSKSFHIWSFYPGPMSRPKLLTSVWLG